MNHRPYLYGMEIKNKYKKPFKFGANMPKKSKWSNSSFWLDFDSDIEKTPKLDIVKLAGYKRAISNFVNIVTGRTDIHVKYNDNDMSYTDGKTITISSKLSDGKSFDTTVGLALHEGSHCLLTDFNYLKGYFNSIHDYNKLNNLKSLINVIEDRRIDSYIYKSAPGYRGYYESMYEEYFYADSINIAIKRKMKSEVSWDNYMFHIINIANPNRDENALPGLKEIYDLIDLKNIDRLKTSQDATKVAEMVYDLIDKLVQENKPDQSEKEDDDQQNQFNSPGGDGSGETREEEDNDEDNDEDNEGEESEEEQEEELTPREKRAKEKAEKEAQKQEEKELKEIAKNLEQDIKKQKDFVEGKIKKGKVSRKQSQQIDSMTSNEVTIERVGEQQNRDGSIVSGKVDVMVIDGITSRILDSGFVSNHYTKSGWRGYDNTEAVKAGMALGILLGKKLKTRDEERVLRTTRCATGKIDSRLIAELGFGAENVFSQIIHYTVKPVYIHLTIDASGSMSGNKWSKSLKTAVAIAKACSMVSNVHVTIDIRGEVNGMYGTPLTWIVYDSAKHNMNHILSHFPYLQATSSTPESLCYESIMKYMIKRANGKESYFITFSDGEPCYYTSSYKYTGESAVNHCKLQVSKLRKNNINVLAYFIVDSDYNYDRTFYEMFKPMYGESATRIDTDHLNSLSRSINSMFERKQN
jgi:hypothetical protein